MKIKYHKIPMRPLACEIEHPSGYCCAKTTVSWLWPSHKSHMSIPVLFSYPHSTSNPESYLSFSQLPRSRAPAFRRSRTHLWCKAFFPISAAPVHSQAHAEAKRWDMFGITFSIFLDLRHLCNHQFQDDFIYQRRLCSARPTRRNMKE